MIELTNYKGKTKEKIFININHIIYFEEQKSSPEYIKKEGAKTTIQLTDIYFVVTETIEQIKEKIQQATGKKIA